jgi:SpoVK/Ycf46/Vps4 family AAA+-type ATPase
MHTAALGSLATALPPGGRWEDLALAPEAVAELRAVESRCRHRERLALEAHRFAPNAGVRVLFTGPSGTGKTLAVRVLAAALGRDVYRVELAAVVNKYIGETEKNLERVLSLAEELDVVLLFDEGDALLARRTAVQSSTDRYANLETNFLLQRLETFEGIVFITTNAGERVDSAFQRRMDAVVELRAPDTDERRKLWQLHLPEENQVGAPLLDNLAAQCPLSGGQIRNASVHARLLALDDGGVVNDERLRCAVQREYRKLGTTCPLRLA